MLSPTLGIDLLEEFGLAAPAKFWFEPAMSADPRLARLCQLIKERYADSGLTLNYAARFAGASRDYLNRLLRRACGVTFKQLLLQVRVSEAVSALLQRPAALVEEVAQKVGFTEISNFGRQFKRRLGCAPKVLKKFFSSGPEESRFLHSRCSELVLDSLTVREITNKVHSGWFRSAINTCGERPDNSEIDWQESAVRARLQDGLAGLIHPTPS